MHFLRVVFLLFCCVPVANGAESRPNILVVMGYVDVLPLEGVSLLPAIRDAKALPDQRVLCWERMGNTAVRQGNWKLVRGYGPASPDGSIALSGPRLGEWELYRVDTDPGETTDLARQEPERVKTMTHLYDTWAKRVGVVPREKIVEQMQPAKK